MKNKQPTKWKMCCARTSLLYGSKPCEERVKIDSSTDLCAEHRKMILPHQLINGTLYIAGEED